jgi:hypothetical protein
MIKKYALLKHSYSELFGHHLTIVKLFDTYEQAKNFVDEIKENLLNRGFEETETNLALTMYNSMNELEVNSYEIEELIL